MNPARRTTASTRPNGGSRSSISTCGTSDSARGSSRSVATSRIRSRCANGHEWAKRQAAAAGIAFTELANGFATTADPAGLQDICDRLGPGTLQVFFERLMARLPLPLTEADRADGYWWELSMRQIEISRTLVFDAPDTGGRSSKPWSKTTWGLVAPMRYR